MSHSTTSFAIGACGTEKVEVTVLGYAYAATGEHDDDNWLSCEVRVHAGAFQGVFRAFFSTEELVDLLQGLTRLHRELKGSYSFEPMEGQLVLAVACNTLAQVQVRARATDLAGSPSSLAFEFALDQTYLASTLRQLAEVTRAFPVRA